MIELTDKQYEKIIKEFSKEIKAKRMMTESYMKKQLPKKELQVLLNRILFANYNDGIDVVYHCIIPKYEIRPWLQLALKNLPTEWFEDQP